MSVGSILPVVRYADPAEAAGWLCSAFGFSISHVGRRPDGGTAYVVLRFGENSVVVTRHGSSVFDDLMVQPADVGNRSTQACYLTIQDVDQHCARALSAGARVEVQPTDDGIGGRFYVCCDPEGHLWSFGNALVGPTLASLDSPSERPRRHPALSARAAIGLAVLVGVAVGCSAIFYLGADLPPKALTAWLGGIRGPDALSGHPEHGANASDTKRLQVSEAAVLELTEKLQTSQLEFAEAQQLKQNAEKLLNASEAEYQSRLRDSQGALDAAVRAKELASQELETQQHRAQAIQTQLDEASQQLARLRGDGSKFESRLKDSHGALDAAVRDKERASLELEAERHRAQAIQVQLDEVSRQLVRLRADGSKFESRLKDSQGALDVAVRDKERASLELESERRRAQTIRTQLDEASQQLARLRADGSKHEVEARQLRDAMAQLGGPLPGPTKAGEVARELATAQSTEQVLRERIRASERESRELELRAKMAVLEMDKEAAGARAEQAAELARTALADVDGGTPRAVPRAPHVRPLPQHRLTLSKKWISVAAIKKAETERQRKAVAVAAAAVARKADEERQQLAAEAAQKAEAERQRKAAAAAAAAQKAEEERQHLAAEAAQKAEAERQRKVAEAAAATQKAEEERQRLAAEAAQKAEAERQRKAAEAAAAARKAEEVRQQLVAEAAQKAEAERQRKAAAAAAATQKAEEERQRVAAEAAQKAEAERQHKAAAAAAATRKAEEERQRLAAEAAQKVEAERQRKAAAAAAAAQKAEEERQRLAAEAAQKAEAERQRKAAEAVAAAAARMAEEERQRVAAEAAQKAEAARRAREAVETKERADQEIRRRTLGLTVTPEDGARFLARGRALLTTGDVTNARLLLERASNAGLADAAMELAETYDPATVTRLFAVGLVGDREQARAWYMRAQVLGSSAAAERLKSIGGQ
jgi:uncharacterized glyoxalase superfamily protein PhnB